MKCEWNVFTLALPMPLETLNSRPTADREHEKLNVVAGISLSSRCVCNSHPNKSIYYCRSLLTLLPCGGKTFTCMGPNTVHCISSATRTEQIRMRGEDSCPIYQRLWPVPRGIGCKKFVIINALIVARNGRIQRLHLLIIPKNFPSRENRPPNQFMPLKKCFETP